MMFPLNELAIMCMSVAHDKFMRYIEHKALHVLAYEAGKKSLNIEESVETSPFDVKALREAKAM